MQWRREVFPSLEASSENAPPPPRNKKSEIYSSFIYLLQNLLNLNSQNNQSMVENAMVYRVVYGISSCLWYIKLSMVYHVVYGK